MRKKMDISDKSQSKTAVSAGKTAAPATKITAPATKTAAPATKTAAPATKTAVPARKIAAKASIVPPEKEVFRSTAAFEKLKKITFDHLKFNLLLLNGPNLNMLGKRDPGQYGTFTLADVETLAAETAFSRGYKIDCFQSNFEGAIIEKIHAAMDLADGIVINPGALTHYSYAILDAIDLCGLPVIEAHISDISAREPFRKISVTAPACCGQVKGWGIQSYARAIHLLCDTIEKRLEQGVL